MLAHCDASVQLLAFSSKHEALQPSPVARSPSSQTSPVSSLPLPQVLAGSQVWLPRRSQTVLAH